MVEEYISKKVKSIIFSLQSPKMIKQMASAKIVTPELYDKEGYPVDGGLMDVRLGVIDPGLKCKTCGYKLKDCVGHFGYIELARPIIHIKFVNLVLSILRSICKDCGKPLAPPEKIESFGKQLKNAKEIGGQEAVRNKVKEIIKYLKTQTKCPHCNAAQLKITIEKPTTFIEDNKRISPIEIRTRLEKLDDEHCKLFGMHPDFAKPDWAILTVLPIPPATMRPSITLESGERSEDDLTHKLGDIVRINQRLFENINAGAPEIIVEDLWDLLQYHITTYFDNAVSQLPPARHRSGQPLKTLTARIKSKEGRIRHNLAGKRTNFSARTVISPDPYLKLNEVGVPMVIAMKLSVPERVTEWNIEYLKTFVDRGPTTYPGANYIVRPDGKKKKITSETKEALLEEIQPGFLIERHLLDGDISIFNRQPSLHRMSMMCHRIRVLPGKTLRLNPAVCHPYNADFDGDEMNLHIPQTEEARAEAEILMEVQTQLISPRYGLSVIGCNQDSLSGLFLLTKEGTTMLRKDAINLLHTIGIEDTSKLPTKDTVTGKEVASVIFPSDFSYSGYSKLYKKPKQGEANTNPKDAIVLINKGKLTSGVLDKNNLGEGKGLLLRTIHKKYGAEFAAKQLYQLFRLGIEYLTIHGFTVEFSDTDLPTEAKEHINQTLNDGVEQVKNLVKMYMNGELEALPGKTERETLELKILEVLNKARNTTGKIVEKEAVDSCTLTMVKSGARGNFLNLAQMAACVGQQAMRGKRIDKGYANRTLSCFRRGDLGPKAHGFIRNSFRSGLSPSEFFFAAMTGRDSLM
ncbi:DNA-directed RNA polymerase subunit A', partial [Candidatus Woesearchaeota archaeon CG08_land_8_20_14_0_20_43_7]